MPITYFDETEHRYPEWVRLNREANRLPRVQGQGPPAKLLLNYGRWLWICPCNAAYTVPADSDVACVYCEVEHWHPIDHDKIHEIEVLLHPTPRLEMHWEGE